jgi:hypothetical protein
MLYDALDEDEDIIQKCTPAIPTKGKDIQKEHTHLSADEVENL